jgi:hypothetical protein
MLRVSFVNVKTMKTSIFDFDFSCYHDDFVMFVMFAS